MQSKENLQARAVILLGCCLFAESQIALSYGWGNGRILGFRNGTDMEKKINDRVAFVEKLMEP